MEENRLFIGNIRRCTKYGKKKKISMNIYIGDYCLNSDYGEYMEIEDELYKEKTILIKTEDNHFIELDNITKIYKISKIKKRNNTLQNIKMTTYPSGEKNLFVDKKSLEPYESIINKAPKAIEKIIK